MSDNQGSKDPPVIEVDWLRDGVAVVTLLGEHDMANAGTIETTIQGLLAHASRVVVDVSRAQFVDSTIIRTLLEGVRQAERDGVDFALVAARNSIARRVLELAALMPSLHVADSVADALPSADGRMPSKSSGGMVRNHRARA